MTLRATWVEQAEMRCLLCKHHWQSLDAAMTEDLTPCPKCNSVRTEPAYSAGGSWQSEGWTWGLVG